MAPQTVSSASVKRTLHVAVPIDRAFYVLTEKMAAWWPATHHLAKTPFTEIVMEKKVGGRWFERAADGEECEWGTVLSWEPPKRVVLAWQLQADWKFSPDLNRASEVCFEFESEGPEATRVEFVHRHLDRHGEGWQKMRDGVNEGWGTVLAPYLELLNGK
jgi:uncharacterized protein YndB with AHSA1/START domain